MDQCLRCVRYIFREGLLSVSRDFHLVFIIRDLLRRIGSHGVSSLNVSCALTQLWYVVLHRHLHILIVFPLCTGCVVIGFSTIFPRLGYGCVHVRDDSIALLTKLLCEHSDTRVRILSGLALRALLRSLPEQLAPVIRSLLQTLVSCLPTLLKPDSPQTTVCSSFSQNPI